MVNSVAMDYFRTRTDLEKYGSNALLLYVLELKFGVDDIDTIAAQALTDGKDDKKCDLVYVDSDRGVAVVAQGYYSLSEKEFPPSNKASDLNTAAGWLLSRNLADLPERIRPAALELRTALESGDISDIEFWYVHNLTESENVHQELATVQQTATNALRALLPAKRDINVRCVEIGASKIEEWYNAMRTPILVTDEFSLGVSGGYTLETPEWKAFVTSIPAVWLYQQYKVHETMLFSANVRDYLGSRRSDSNINHGIKRSAEEEPTRFWAYNNGITALVNEFEVECLGGKQNLKIKGLSIVNGAQTTGALGSLATIPNQDTMVSARFIRCSNPEIVQNIVRYNNSQNKVDAADFRSNDPIQERLRQEFRRHDIVTYQGGRRGGTDDAIRRPQNLLPSDTAAQSLAAFHGLPNVAYNRKSQLWESDHYYTRIFNDNTHADHLLFVYSLNRTIGNLKIELMNEEEPTDFQKRSLEFLRYRGSLLLLMATIGESMEIFVGRPVTDKFLLRFSDSGPLASFEQRWVPIVRCCLAFRDQLMDPLKAGTKSQKDIDVAIHQTKQFLEATRQANELVYAEFSDTILLEPRHG